MLALSGGSGRSPVPLDLIGCGDSHTLNEGTGVLPHEFYPGQLQRMLAVAKNANLVVVNAGHSGNTSSDLLMEANLRATPARPFAGVVYVGTNDYGLANRSAVQASPSPTSTAFGIETGKGARFRAGDVIFVGGVSRTILSVAADLVTLTAPLPGAPSAGVGVQLDTTEMIVKIGNKLLSIGYTRLIVGLQHYLNFSTSGDTTSPAQGTGMNLTLRNQQRAAAATLGAEVADFYEFMRKRIIDGKDVQGSAGWHVADLNTHLNAYGERLLAECITAAIPTSWYPALQQ